MMLYDSKGNAFTWQVHCIAKPADRTAIMQCVHCHGTGESDIVSTYDYQNEPCSWCSGTGARKLQIPCTDHDLERYLEQYIDQYYADKKSREDKAFLDEGI